MNGQTDIVKTQRKSRNLQNYKHDRQTDGKKQRIDKMRMCHTYL